MEESIMAVIVTFNPDIVRLKENVSAIENQVDEIYIYDNDSQNRNQIENAIVADKLYFNPAEKNFGMSKALNDAIEYARNKGHRWVLQLDQDSVFPPGGIVEYREVIDEMNGIGMISPQIIDRNYDSEVETSDRVSVIKRAINSGALISVSAWEKIGGYDENLFLDCVDFDFDKRLCDAGLLIVRANNVRLLHELGRSRKIRIGRRSLMVYNYSAQRKKIQLIDQFYYEQKHGKTITIFSIMKRILKYILIVIFYEEDKMNKISSILEAGRVSIKRYV